MQHRPLLAVGHLYSGEEHRVEVDIWSTSARHPTLDLYPSLTVLAHELVKFHVVRVPPPFLPVRSVVCRDGGVPDGCVQLSRDQIRVSRNGKFLEDRLPRRL